MPETPPAELPPAELPTAIPPALAWHLSDQLGYLTSLLITQTAAALESERLQVPEFVALVVLLSFPEGLSQTAWGRLQGVSRQRAHVITNKLTGLQLVEVERRGRSSLVRLSATGKEYVARLQPTVSRALATLLGALSEAEARSLSALLEKAAPHPLGPSGVTGTLAGKTS